MDLTLTPERPGNLSGPLSPGELSFCRQTLALVRAALDGRVSFVGVVANLLPDLRELRKSAFDVEAALASGFTPAIARPELVTFGTPGSNQLSTLDRSFLEDLDGFLDFALRNGLTFPSILNVLAHDVNEIAAHEMSLEKAAADFVVPKATGWAERNRESMRVPDPVAEDERGEPY